MRLIILFFLITFLYTNESSELLTIAKKIYQNECSSNPKKLVHWNKGEPFPSLGIGHFIWYPKSVHERFEESFPKLIAFMKEKNIKLPKWLYTQKGAPWSSAEELENSQKAKELKLFLSSTIDVQALFMANRVKSALPKMLNAAPKHLYEHIKKQFMRVANSPYGYYLLIDYVNFKGEGVKPSERYNGQGWGLLQVLELMKGKKTGIETRKEFAKCAKEVLLRRVKNAPKNRGEERWLKGWFNRIDTY